MTDDDGTLNNGPSGLTRPEGSSKRRLMVAIIAVSCVVIGLGAYFYMKQAPKTIVKSESTDTKQKLMAWQPAVGYPLYYPSKLPKNYAVHFGQASQNVNAVTVPVLYPGGTLYITEQELPPVTETLKKVKEFPTPLGSGFTANLEGKQAGFIKTAQTLLIFSPTDKIEAGELQYIMQHMQPVQ